MKICLPKHIQELYQRYTSAANVPRLGVDDNYYFQALQLNISPAISVIATAISNPVL
jgi:hypothetical protein